ncbi:MULTISPECIES: EpsG family protein [Pseudomonas]|uniref:EpsG family protein n=1 Tax=Pseudomonas azadiae TaxID=2843612 RepID=A0ABS6P223_9PSED|nr:MULTISPECIES: EpsG family protein [Pseudomonas]MBV4454521.1 EpsG family protein [Pseudomonas azadiae]NMF39679.1 EpsG family protein [Pseudomonas sp. SWRI 103]
MMLLLTALSGYRTRLFSAVALLFLLFVSVFRGAVGTDTNTYETVVGRLMERLSWTGMEPGFVFMSWLLGELTGSAVIAVRLVSVIIFIILFLYLFRSDKNEKFLLLSYMLPAFVYQYTMNGLRIGIAAMLLLLAVQKIRKLQKLSGLALALSALMFHYSSLVSLIFIWASQARWARASNILIVPFASAVVLAIFSVNGDYFSAKLLSYQGSESPSPFSGLGKIAVVLVLVVGVALSKLPRTERSKLIFLGTGFTVFFWMVSSISYAGLRFLDLISFAYPLAILLTYGRCQLDFDRAIKIFLFFAGLIAVFSSYRNFVSEYGEGPSPFLPYHLSEPFAEL